MQGMHNPMIKMYIRIKRVSRIYAIKWKYTALGQTRSRMLYTYYLYYLLLQHTMIIYYTFLNLLRLMLSPSCYENIASVD